MSLDNAGSQGGVDSQAGGQVQGSAPVQGGAQESSAWFSGFSDDNLKGYVQSKNFKTPEALAKSYQNLETLMGEDKAGNTVVLPKTREDAEGWNAIYDKLGRPGKPDGYQLEVPEGVDPTFSKEASETFHKLGLTAEQGQNLAQWWNAKAMGMQEAINAQKQAQFKAEDEALRNEWGPKFVENVAKARNAQKALGIDDATIDTIAGAIGHKGAMNLLQKIGSLSAEDKFIGSNGASGSVGSMDISQARYEMQKLKNNPDFRKKILSGDLDAKAQVARLTNIINQ